MVDTKNNQGICCFLSLKFPLVESHSVPKSIYIIHVYCIYSIYPKRAIHNSPKKKDDPVDPRPGPRSPWVQASSFDLQGERVSSQPPSVAHTGRAPERSGNIRKMAMSATADIPRSKFVRPKQASSRCSCQCLSSIKNGSDQKWPINSNFPIPVGPGLQKAHDRQPDFPNFVDSIPILPAWIVKLWCL